MELSKNEQQLRSKLEDANLAMERYVASADCTELAQAVRDLNKEFMEKKRTAKLCKLQLESMSSGMRSSNQHLEAKEAEIASLRLRLKRLREEFNACRIEGKTKANELEINAFILKSRIDHAAQPRTDSPQEEREEIRQLMDSVVEYSRRHSNSIRDQLETDLEQAEESLIIKENELTSVKLKYEQTKARFNADLRKQKERILQRHKGTQEALAVTLKQTKLQTVRTLEEQLEEARRLEHDHFVSVSDLEKARVQWHSQSAELQQLTARVERLKVSRMELKRSTEHLAQRITDTELEMGVLKVKYFAEELLK